jgi:hypothetical protein
MNKKISQKKKYIMICVVVVMLVITSIVVGYAAQAFQLYIKTVIQLEHQEHYEKLRDHTWELARAFEALSVYDDLIEKRLLKDEEKEDVKSILRNMEEAGLNISRRNLFYAEDTTAHMFLVPTKNIVDFFDEARNTELYIERCVRFVETGLTLPYPSQKQKESVREQCGLLAEEIERLKAFTK